MQLPEVDRIRIAGVVDNCVVVLLQDQGPAKRRPRQVESHGRYFG